jgi:paraquat-inducible protein B
MNEGRGAFLRVGLLVVGGLALVVGLVWFFGGNRLSHALPFESYFSESVQGLEVGAPVKYRGVTIGRVTDLGLVTAEYGRRNTPTEFDRQTYRLVFVRFAVDPRSIGLPLGEADVADSVKLGLRVRLDSQGITGLTYMELDFVDPTTYPAVEVPWTPRDPYVPSMPSTLLQVKNGATEFLAKLNRVDIDALSTSLLGLLTELRANLDHGDVHLTLSRSSELLRTLNDSVQAADLPGLTADLRRTSGTVRDLAASGDLHRTLANAALASDRLAAASTRLGPLIAALQAVAGRTDSGVADLVQELLPVLRDARSVVANLRDATDELRRYPAQTLLAEPPPRPRDKAK